MNYNYLKKLSIVALSLMTSAMSMMAANTLSVGGFSVGDKQEHQLTIDLNSDGKVSVMQFEITLPEGLSLTTNFAKTNALGEGYSVSQTAFGNNAQKYLVVVANQNLTPITQGEQVSILTFGVTAGDNYNPDGSKIVISNVKGANQEGAAEDVELAQNGEFLNQTTGSMTGRLTVSNVSEVSVTLNLQNNIEFYHLGATINLPEGIDIADGEIVPVEGIDIQYDKIEGQNAYSIILGTGQSPIAKTFGDAITFKLVATSDFDGNACKVTVTDVNASDANAKSYDLDMVEITIDEETAEILKDAVLVQAKADAIAAIEAAAEATKNEGETVIAANIQEVVTTATDAINGETSVDGVNSKKDWALALIPNMDAYNEYIDQLKADLDNAVEKDAEDKVIDAEGYDTIVDGAKTTLESKKAEYNNGESLDNNKGLVKEVYDVAVESLATNRSDKFEAYQTQKGGEVAALAEADGNNTDEIQGLINTAKDKIAQLTYDAKKQYADNIAAIDAIVTELNNDIKAVKDAAALAKAKEEAKSQIISYAGITPAEPGSKEMQAIVEEINAAIDEAETVAAINQAVEAGMVQIAAQKEKEQQAAALAEAKEKAKAAITVAVNEGLEEGDAPAADVAKAGQDAIAAIEAAETVDDVAAAKQAGLDEIARLKQLAVDKTDAIAAIDSMVKELYPDNDAPESVNAAVAAAKQAINDALTSEAVATAKENGIAAINAAVELVANKATAIAAIDAKVAEIAGEGQAPEAVTAAAATAKENIAAAEDNDGVDAAKQAGLDAIQLIMDKAAFEAYKTEVKESFSELTEEEEANQTVLDLIADAETALTELAYDEEKSLDENKNAVDAIKSQLESDVKAERLRDFTAHKTIALAALEAAKTTAPDVAELNTIYEASKKSIEDAEYDDLFTLIGNKAALDYYVDEYKDAVQKYVYVNNYTEGDINEDGEVDIYDYAKLAKFIMGLPAGYESTPELFSEMISAGDSSWEKERLFNLYDANNDKSIDVVDLTAIVNIIIGGAANTQPETTGAKGKMAGTATISAELVGNDLIFNLTNSAQLVAMQMDITISGAEVMAEQLSRRAGAHELMISNLGGNQYRIMIVGAANEMFEGGKGELFRLSMNGVADNVEFGKIVAADARANSYAVAVGGTVTGVNAIDAESAAVKSYTIGGQQQNSVKAGLNIVVGADGKARKVLK